MSVARVSSRRAADASVRRRPRNDVIDDFGSRHAIVPRMAGRVAQDREVPEAERQKAQDRSDHTSERTTKRDVTRIKRD